jgi:hypothetical protein
MKCFSRKNLQTSQIYFVPAIKPDVFPGKIPADDTDEFHRREKARGDGGVTGRTAEQPESSAVEPTIKTLIFQELEDGSWKIQQPPLAF